MKQFLILVLLLQKFYWINGQKATGIRTLAPVYVLTIGKNIRNGRDHGVSTSLNNSVGINYSEINRKNVYPFRNYDVMLNYVKTVSYTHLDVYKRQTYPWP